MMFLAPTAALVAAAIGLPALAVLYLLKLRRRPVRVSSTLLWQQAHDDLEANVPWRLARPSWLILLHILLVVLAILIIGRPAVGAGSGAASRYIFIIDRSASMSAMDGVGVDGVRVSRLEEARRRALKIVEDSMRLGRDIEAAVIAASSESRALLPLSSDRRLIRSAIESVTPSDQPLDLDEALRLAGALLGSQGDDGAETEAQPRTAALIIVVSDGAVGGDGVVAPSGSSLRLERVGPSPPLEGEAGGFNGQNAGILTMNARRDAENPASVRVFMELGNAASTPVERVVTLLLDGVEIQRRGVLIPAASPAGVGRSSLTFDLSTRGGGLLDARLEGSDILAADDRVSMLLAAPRPPSILLVSPQLNAPGGDPAGAGSDSLSSEWLLESILTELKPAQLRVERGEPGLRLARGAPGMFDLVVFNGITPQGAIPVPSIVLGGGMPGIGIVQRGPQTEGQREFVLSWERAHPLLRDVSLDTAYGMSSSGLILDVPAAASVVPLALGATAPMMVLAEVGGVRHVISSMGVDDSNWGIQVGFAIFLSNAVDFLTLRSDEQARSAIRIAESIEVDVPPQTSTAVLEGPERREITLPPQAAGGGERRVSLGRVERVGVYSVNPPEARPSRVAVNLMDPLETAVQTSASIRIRGRSGESLASAGEGLPREITAQLLVAMLALLVIEWIAFARTSRV